MHIFSQLNMKTSENMEEFCSGGTPAVLPAPCEEMSEEDWALFAEEEDSSEGYKVILYNDEFHSFDQVIAQLMIATRCDREMAEAIAYRAHSNGTAIVVITDKPEADKVAGILRRIALKVAVEPF